VETNRRRQCLKLNIIPSSSHTSKLYKHIHLQISLEWGETLKEEGFESNDSGQSSIPWNAVYEQLLDHGMLISPVSSVALKKAVNAFEPFAGVVFDGKLVFDGTQPASSGLPIRAMKFGVHGEIMLEVSTKKRVSRSA